MNAGRTIRRLVPGLTAAIAAAAMVVPAGAGATRGPGGLAFYHPPKHLPRAHGSLIWSRPAGGLVPLDKAKSTDLVLYTSKSPQGKDVAVSGSVSVPKGKAPKGGWPVISYAHGTTGTADACAPSRNHNGDPVTSYISYVDPQQNAWLKAGYAVVRTDYQGLGTPGPHPYLIGESEGRSVLDMVRAARDLDPSIGKKFLIAGHSQGGHAALFAAGEAKRYVPDLRLRGTVAYAPASHLKEQGQALGVFTSPSPLTALATLIVQGATTESTHATPIKAKRLLAPEVMAFYPKLNKLCLPQLSLPSRLGGIAPADMIKDGADTTDLFDLLGEQNPAVKTKAPIMLAQGDADATVYKFLTDSLNTELQNKGDDVTYDVYPGIDHGGVVAAAENDALNFFQARLPAG